MNLPPHLAVTYDEKRQGYIVKGMGFDFFAYFTGDCGESENTFIECDHVIRYGYDAEGHAQHLQLPINSVRRLSCDVLETLLVKELAEYWILA